jgi:hypothetical protein
MPRQHQIKALTGETLLQSPPSVIEYSNPTKQATSIGVLAAHTILKQSKTGLTVVKATQHRTL